MTYVGLPVLASLAGVSRRALEKVCAKNAVDSIATWRGTRLVLRQVRGRGGRSGLQYEIRIDSLPVDLQQRLKDAERPSPPRLKEINALTALLRIAGNVDNDERYGHELELLHDIVLRRIHKLADDSLNNAERLIYDPKPMPDADDFGLLE
jgi:hypothetical protein